MKNKQINHLLSVGAVNSKLNSLRKIELPYLMRKEEYKADQVGVFTSEDVIKIIEHIVNRGQRFVGLKNKVSSQQASKLEQKLYKSSFVQVIIRRTLNKMGDERRLGTGLRGFSKLLLQQIEKDCWHLILLQLQLLRNQLMQQKQKQVLESI